MKFTPTPLAGSYLIDLDLREDERGFFARYFCEKEFLEKGLNTRWTQINNSMSFEAGTLRGLHFQRPPHAEIKLIRCIHGSIWDVIVDIRSGSGTYGQWFGAVLSADNRTMMYVPNGFAHGFVSLQSNSEILYMVSDAYSPEHEDSLLWSDSMVGIDWPLMPQVISEKDSIAKTLDQIESVLI